MLYTFKQVIVCLPPFRVPADPIKPIEGSLEIQVRGDIRLLDQFYDLFILIKPHALSDAVFYNFFRINVYHYFYDLLQ